ncbi:MAG: PfkB family carbohydrate kinase [Novosphingobium sp.]
MARIVCFGDADAVAHHWQSLGCAEALVKIGERGCRLPDGNIMPPPVRLEPVATSGGGDAFNAGYLAGRLADLTVDDAARVGQHLAGCVIMRPGAIPAAPEWPDLLEYVR